MKSSLKSYLDTICTIKADAMEELIDLFKPASLKKSEVFARDGEYCNQVGFLNKGIVRAYFVNDEGKEYTKQFFVGPTIIGAYTSLLTRQANKIAQ
jgi:CRP-like cAMP-binding protein